MAQRKALITGITGQDGSYLAEHLLALGYDVVGMVRRTSTINFERIAHLQDRITIAFGDLLDEASITTVLAEHRPDEVYNLAAQSFPHASWAQAVFTGESTALGVTRVLDAIRHVDANIRFCQASSSEVFGKATSSPQNESTPFHPQSPYGVAKVYGHWITVNYREAYGMHATSAILFNHESPRRGKEFVTRKVTHAVARIHLGLQDKLALGNIDAVRDWGFAGDYVRAMHLALQHDHGDTYVIGTGQTHSVRNLCEAAFGHVGLDWSEFVSYDETLSRPSDSGALVADSSKARAALGWVPSTSFEALVAMMVDADLAELTDTRS